MAGQIMWLTLCIGIVVVMLSWMKSREKIPFEKRDKVEKILMVLLIIALIVDVSFAVMSRADDGKTINDCIGFYRYFPDFVQPEDYEFSFLKKCEQYFDEEDINKLRESGRVWNAKRLENGFLFNN